MSEKLPLTHPDRLKWLRNVNLLGAGALLAAGVYIPAAQEALFVAAAVNTAQAGGAEAWRQHKLNRKSQAISQTA